MFVFCPEAAMSDERGSGEKITGAVWLRGILWLLMSFLFLYVLSLIHISEPTRPY